MARTWLVDIKGIARKVKNATQLSTYEIKDCGATRECPSCHHLIDNSDVSVEWPGLPAGVKFDPSDVELLEHLAGKVGFGDARPHILIDEFIPALEGDEGICYTHPENLPGAKKDGSSVHFFHRTSKAYATGHRKRRKIHGHYNSTEDVRWHKTGKTKPVMDGGLQKGFKKIMVLYGSSKKGSKPDKSNWVMHQYHLGTKENEADGEFVVSKIFYQQQPKQMDQRDIVEESVAMVKGACPSTPNTYMPIPPRAGKRPLLDEIDEENWNNSPTKVAEFTSEAPQRPSEDVHFDDGKAEPDWWATDSQVPEDLDSNNINALLLCNEILDTNEPINEFELKNDHYFVCSDSNKDYLFNGDSKTSCETKGGYWGISDLGNLEFETPPDFDLAVSFISQLFAIKCRCQGALLGDSFLYDRIWTCRGA
ncbi:hypothetical protein IFM89_024291 [Coptis chinensis]|uniref:NAC domain-containing protein n=1 Tax=Coptis chinensis TaxID=261450 RepID=A0A835HXQ7_9MAGN|nr:hypothetical protein IFM89_024291 [Coptis chinensis]